MRQQEIIRAPIPAADVPGFLAFLNEHYHPMCHNDPEGAGFHMDEIRQAYRAGLEYGLKQAQQ